MVSSAVDKELTIVFLYTPKSLSPARYKTLIPLRFSLARRRSFFGHDGYRSDLPGTSVISAMLFCWTIGTIVGYLLGKLGGKKVTTKTKRWYKDIGLGFKTPSGESTLFPEAKWYEAGTKDGSGRVLEFGEFRR